MCFITLFDDQTTHKSTHISIHIRTHMRTLNRYTFHIPTPILSSFLIIMIICCCSFSISLACSCSILCSIFSWACCWSKLAARIGSHVVITKIKYIHTRCLLHKTKRRKRVISGKQRYLNSDWIASVECTKVGRHHAIPRKSADLFWVSIDVSTFLDPEYIKRAKCVPDCFWNSLTAK